MAERLELEPCPFCGEGCYLRAESNCINHRVSDSFHSYGFRYWWQCDACEIRGPLGKDLFEATAQWNRRGQPPPRASSSAGPRKKRKAGKRQRSGGGPRSWAQLKPPARKEESTDV